MFPPSQAVVYLSLSLIPSFVPNFFLFSLTLSLVLFRHILVFALTPLFPPPSFLSSSVASYDFPNCMFCVLAVLVETHIVHLTAATWGWKKKIEWKVRGANIVPLESWLGSKREGVRETFWQREERRWEQTLTLQILCVFLWCGWLSVEFQTWFWRHEGLRWLPDIMPPAPV